MNTCQHGLTMLCRECSKDEQRRVSEGIRGGTLTYAVVPWRGDGRYSLDQAHKTYRIRSAAEKCAEYLTDTNAQPDRAPRGFVVRTLNTGGSK